MSSKFLQIFLFGLVLTISANAATCSKSYTLGFFNGVWNTEQQADKGLKALSQLVGGTYNNEPVNYKTFYNHTGPGYDVIGLQDLAETFIQRSAEIDASGELGRRFEYFWEFIGSSEPTFIDKIKGIFSNAVSLFDSLFTAVNTKLVAIISYFTSNPPTESDYAVHNAKLDALAADGQKLMLVGHSQGNLFMNHAYDHILPSVGKDRVAAAHIAPASPTLRGDYVLANIDLVINALRIQGVNSVPDINLTIPVSKVDVSGHTLIGTYLDPTRDGRERIKSMIEAEMGGLKCLSYTGDIILYKSAVIASNPNIGYSHVAIEYKGSEYKNFIYKGIGVYETAMNFYQSLSLDVAIIDDQIKKYNDSQNVILLVRHDCSTSTSDTEGVYYYQDLVCHCEYYNLQ